MADLRSILLIEDSENDVELTLSALDGNRIANQVIVARDGAEGLDYLFARGSYAGRGGGAPGVVLLDLKLPKVDGLEVLRQLKSDARLKHIPVVMLTSSKEERDLVESYRLGVSAYVVKPLGFREFIEAIQNLGLFWGVLNQLPPSLDGPR